MQWSSKIPNFQNNFQIKAEKWIRYGKVSYGFLMFWRHSVLFGGAGHGVSYGFLMFWRHSVLFGGAGDGVSYGLLMFWRHSVLFWRHTEVLVSLDTSGPFLNPGSQCCGSGMFISDPDFYPSRFLIFTHPGSRISDPGSKNSNKRERWKKISFHNFLCSHRFHKIANYFSFEEIKKKIWHNFQRTIEFFPKNWSIIFKKNVFGIRDPGSRKVKKSGSGIKIPDPQHKWYLFL
jgi:hypothetical protein